MDIEARRVDVPAEAVAELARAMLLVRTFVPREADIAVDAANAYLAMRARTHEAALNDEDTVRVKPGELEAEREAVRRLRSRLFGPANR